MKVGIASDHGGFEMKQKIYILLGANGHQVKDFGNFEYDSHDDYPDFAIPLAQAVAAGVIERGILLCSSGVGGSKGEVKIPSEILLDSPCKRARRLQNRSFII
jgi:RpiB/LacA/LacB family sugar-phosphate isomerase